METPTITDVLDSIQNNALDPAWFDDAPDTNPFQVVRWGDAIYIKVGAPSGTVMKITVESGAAMPSLGGRNLPRPPEL